MGFITTINERGREVYACEFHLTYGTGTPSYPCRAHPCPAGWCQRYYICAGCWPAVSREDWGTIHRECAGRRAKFRAEQAMKAARLASGIPNVQAGVALPSGRVFAWTTAGNYEVPSDVYERWLENGAEDMSGAVVRSEAYPPEVYGQR